eukprot:scaffold470367_cov18-Prasinocladus_malaysianus.AAC.1
MLGFDCGGQQWVLETAFPTGELRLAVWAFVRLCRLWGERTLSSSQSVYLIAMRLSFICTGQIRKVTPERGV